MQKITSAATSLNQIPAIYRLVDKQKGWGWLVSDTNLDLGGGKFNRMTEVLLLRGTTNVVIDPYNRTDEHNADAREFLRGLGGASSCTLSNVLNVIKEPSARRAALEEARDRSRDGARLYVTVYVGDRSSRGRKTTKGWQANRPLRSYLREVRKVWPGARVKGGMIVAQKEA